MKSLPLIYAFFFCSFFFKIQATEEPTTFHPTEAPTIGFEEKESIESIAGLLFSGALLFSFTIGLILHKTGFKYLTSSGGAIIVGLIVGCIVR